MRLMIRHTTRYVFEEPVSYGLQQLRKTPKSGPGQDVIRWDTVISGGKKELEYQDHFNNIVELISFEREATEITIRSEGEIEVLETHGVVGTHRGPTPLWLFEGATDLTKAGSGGARPDPSDRRRQRSGPAA